MEPQIYARMGAVEDRHWWFVGRRRIIMAALARLGPLPRPARVLEAGCGTGGNLVMLSQLGPVSAFEPDDQARFAASAKGLYDIRRGRMPDAVPFQSDRFDLCVMLDVLEHLDDDVASLAALAGRLEPGGRMLVTVPAFGFLWSEHDVARHHRRRYTRRKLKAAARAAGLRPIATGYFNALLFPVIVAVRLARWIAGTQRDDDCMPARAVNAAMRTIFGLERHLIGRLPMPFGVSLLMVAEKAER